VACTHPPSETCPRCAATAEQKVGPDDDTLVRDEPTVGPHDVLQPGARVGRYLVLEPLGHGGMGVLYVAHDPQLDRKVAIKLLRTAVGSGASSSSGQVRLLREAQAMAQLSHPNVVPVYDVGEFGDGVFVAMELVPGGLTLDQWVKQQPRPWREVLQVFLAAGRGLVAAHAAGLMHRDFKPSNVLMGEDGRPRVTDFGLARSMRTAPPPVAVADDEPTPAVSLSQPITLAGVMMGSPGYMAPEQYEGAEMSAATDQFAFCVSLYEALYGARPFTGKTLPELQWATSKGQVPPPPKGTPVPPWIHRILVRGLSPDPAQRHPSMAALLEALAHDPAVARRRWLAGGLALLTVGLVAGGGLWLNARQARVCRGAEQKLAGVWDDRVRRAAAAAFEGTGKPFARQAWDGARAAMDAYAAQWVVARTEACEATRLRGELNERQLLLRLSCLDRRLDELAELGRAFSSADGEVVVGAMNAVSRLSPLQSCANMKGLEERRQPVPEQVALVDLLQQQLAQGRALTSAGRFAEARKRIEPALAQSRALDLPTLRAEAEQALGTLELEAEHFPAAVAALGRAAAAAEEAGDDLAAARALASMVSAVGWRLERPDEARTLAALAQGIVARLGGDLLLTATLGEGVGDTEWQAGNRAESLRAYRAALADYEKVQGPESVDVARLHSSIGWVLTVQGELNAARAEFERSKAIREKLLGADHPALANTWNELSALEIELGDYPAAVASARRELEVSLLIGADSPAVFRARIGLSAALARGGKPEEALRAVKDGEAMMATLPSVTDVAVTELVRIKVEALAAQQKLDEAVKAGRAGLAEAERKLGAEHPDVVPLSLSLAAPLAALGQHAEALALCDRFVAVQERTGAQRAPRLPEALSQGALSLLALGRGGEAIPRLERAAKLLESPESNRQMRPVNELRLAQALWVTAPGRWPPTRGRASRRSTTPTAWPTPKRGSRCTSGSSRAARPVGGSGVSALGPSC